MYLRRNDSRYQCRLGAMQKQSSSAEKNLEVAVDTKLNMSHMFLSARRLTAILDAVGKILLTN